MDQRPCDVCRTPTRTMVQVEGRIRRVRLCSAFCRGLYLDTHPPPPRRKPRQAQQG